MQAPKKKKKNARARTPPLVSETDATSDAVSTLTGTLLQQNPESAHH
jgi:hypothetical protein